MFWMLCFGGVRVCALVARMRRPLIYVEFLFQQTIFTCLLIIIIITQSVVINT